jgi:hypothetical protein
MTQCRLDNLKTYAGVDQAIHTLLRGIVTAKAGASWTMGLFDAFHAIPQPWGRAAQLI